VRRDVFRVVWLIVLLALPPFCALAQAIPPDPETWCIYPGGHRELWRPGMPTPRPPTRNSVVGTVVNAEASPPCRLTEVRVVQPPMRPPFAGRMPASASVTPLPRAGTGFAASRSQTASSPSEALQPASTRSNALRPRVASDGTLAVDSGPPDESTIDGSSPVMPQGLPLEAPATGSVSRVASVEGKVAPLDIRPGPPNGEILSTVTGPASNAASLAATVPTGNRSGDTPWWLTVGIANLLGTLTGLLVGLPIVTAAAYLLLSRFKSGSMRDPASLERLGDFADRDNAAHAADESTADGPSESREEQLGTVVADFADDRVAFRIVGETYDEQQKAQADREREQTQEILRHILEDNVALCAEVSARRSVG
jgi:hypothetical protein